MSDPVFGAPRLATPYVHRARIRDRIDAGARGPLTVLCGPPGSGKTFAASDWSAHRDAPGVALWLTIDDTMAQQAGFWNRALLTAIDAGIASETDILARLIASPQPGDELRQNLKRGITQLNTDIILVLDEFQRITDSQVHADLLWLLQNTANLHLLIMTSDIEPVLRDTSLTGLSPTFIDKHELLMTSPEVNEAITLFATGHTVLDADELRAATNGLPLLVRLALGVLDRLPVPADEAIRLPELLRQRIDSYLDKQLFSERLPASFSAFLLRVSVTEYFDAELAAELVPGEDVHRFIQFVEAAGVGTWQDLDGRAVFRIVPLVRDSLVTRLHRMQPEDVPGLHLLVTRWALRTGHGFLAIEHVAHAQNVDLLIEVTTTYYINFTHHYGPRLRDIIEQMPKSELAAHPEIFLLLVLLYNTNAATKPRALDLIHRVVLRHRTQILANPDPLRLTWIRAALIAVYRIAGMHRASVALARQVLDAGRAGNPALSTNPAGDGLALLHASVTFLHVGDTQRAIEAASLVSLIPEPTQAKLSNAPAALALIAYIHAFSGKMNEARAYLAEADRFPAPEGWRSSYNGVLYNLTLALLALNDYNLPAARAALAATAPHRATIEHWPLIAHVDALVGLVSNQGFGALTTMDHAIVEHEKLPHITQHLQSLLHSVRAQVLIALHNTQAANESVRQAIASDEMTMLSAAATHLATGELLSAVPILDSLAWSHTATVAIRMNALTMKAIIATVMRDDELASASIDRAFQLGNAYGYRLAFLFMPTDALRAAIQIWQERHPGDTPFIDAELLPVFVGFERGTMARLTPREQAVLNMLVKTADRDEIAQALFVSPNTVKSQLRSVYRKLGASTREEAILSASEQGLFSN